MHTTTDPAPPGRVAVARPTEPDASPATTPDLVVFSHLRWSWVWQRPQHVVSRLAVARRTWFVEEPLADDDVDAPVMRWRTVGNVTVATLHVPGPERHLGFDAPEAQYLAAEIARAARGSVPVVWLYTPLALDAARLLDPCTLAFDVMDDLSSFAGAPVGLVERHREALADADVVFTGGRSLHRGVTAIRPGDTYLFPSGVESEHYAPAIGRRQLSDRPVAGYVGVIDERIDLDLLARLAERLPDWEIRIVGPVAKIGSDALPQRSNLTYPGPATYQQLPDVMAGFHVALMPFAMNEATRSISPTKTLEYLAAGLPVVSTRVPDVVADYAHVVHLADDGDAFADACRSALAHLDDTQRHAVCRPLLDWQHWDRIALRMDSILRSAEAEAAGLERSA